jgi:hypothetical protein
MADTTPGAAIHFIGPPSRLRWAAADVAPIASASAVRLAQATHLKSLAQPLSLRRGRDPAHARLRLDPATPPGLYAAVLETADGKQHPVTVSVQAHPRLRVVPSALHLVGAPGAEVSARLLLENRGNTDIAIGSSLISGVFDDDGIETAMASTYRMETDDINKLVGNVFSRLREAHGGLLRIRVSEGGDTPLKPNERRVIVLSTTLNGKLARGHQYHGVLDIGDHGIAVSITVDGAKAETQKGA